MLLVRRLRGIGLSAIVWCMLWLPFGLGAGIFEYTQIRPYDTLFFDGERLTLSKPPLLPLLERSTIVWAVWGAVGGIIFATSMMLAERNRSMSELSTPRFAAWGGYAAMLLPGFVMSTMALTEKATIPMKYILFLLFSGVYGAVCATGILRLARRRSG